jgi:hypothetical protein
LSRQRLPVTSSIQHQHPCLVAVLPPYWGGNLTTDAPLVSRYIKDRPSQHSPPFPPHNRCTPGRSDLLGLPAHVSSMCCALVPP